MDNEEVSSRFADMVYRDTYDENAQRIIDAVAVKMKVIIDQCDLLIDPAMIKFWSLIASYPVSDAYNEGLNGEYPLFWKDSQ